MMHNFIFSIDELGINQSFKGDVIWALILLMIWISASSCFLDSVSAPASIACHFQRLYRVVSLLILMYQRLFLHILQVAFVGFVTCTMFLKTRIHPTDLVNGNLYLSCLFFALIHMMFNGFSELPLLIFRLPVFYKQRDNLFYPAWAWSFCSWILRLPYSVIEAVVWSCVVYWAVGFAPGAGRYVWFLSFSFGMFIIFCHHTYRQSYISLFILLISPLCSRFFCYLFALFAVHQMGMGLFRSVASIARDLVISNTIASAALLVTFLLGGFILPKGKFVLFSKYL